MSLLAALASAVACWLLVGPAGAARLRPGRQAGRVALRATRWAVPLVVVAGAAAAGGMVAGGGGTLIGVAVALPALTVVRLWRLHRARAVEARVAQEVASACQLLAGLLRVGHVPAAALGVAARDAPVLAEVAAALAVGGAAAPVLRRLGTGRGRAGLTELGVAWEVAERSGASLTATLDALADRLTARQAVRDVVAAELAAPRATGRLLAALPVAGVLLGYSFGGDPLGFLTGSLPGQASLVAGVALGCAGVLWTERIAETGED